MTIKDLKKEFDYVVKVDGKFHIHSKGGMRCNYKYLATVVKKGNSFFVEGFSPTTNMDVLKNQIKEFADKLPFDSEYFSPLFRKGYKEEMIVHDYLQSINFKYIGDNFYEFKNPSLYGYQATKIKLLINGLDSFSEIKDIVEINLLTSDSSWISTKSKRDAREIINSIDSLLKPLFLTESISNIKTSEKMEVSEIDLILKKIKNLDIEEVDIKQHLKNQLLEIAEKI